MVRPVARGARLHRLPDSKLIRPTDYWQNKLALKSVDLNTDFLKDPVKKRIEDFTESLSYSIKSWVLMVRRQLGRLAPNLIIDRIWLYEISCYVW